MDNSIRKGEQLSGKLQTPVNRTFLEEFLAVSINRASKEIIPKL